jgi:hypothetical protein
MGETEKVPEHEAAYAAGLWSCGPSWAEVADMLKHVGMGDHRHDKLARAALAWMKAHVEPKALKLIRRRRTEIAARVRHKRDPGRCFRRAGWREVGVSKSHRHRGALVFEAPSENS